MFYAPKIYVSKKNVLHNLTAIRGYIGKNKKVCLTIKSDAYGHGLNNMLEILKNQKIEYFGISSVEEADLVQTAIDTWSQKPKILLYAHQIKEDLEAIMQLDCEFLVGDVEYFKNVLFYASKLQKKVKIHIHLDTGMGRLGLLEHDIQEFCALLRSHMFIDLVGISTHFSQSTDNAVTQKQLERYAFFKKILQKNLNLEPTIIEHTANSGALLWQKQSYFDMLRPGLLLYGSYPSGEHAFDTVNVKPVMKLVAYIARVKHYPARHGISYGSTYRTTKETNIAVVNIGYGKGILKAIENKAHVLIHNTLYPLVGAVTMDMCMVDLGMDTAKVGDEVVFWGDESLRIDDLAEKTNVISYEFTCIISPTIERIVV